MSKTTQQAQAAEQNATQHHQEQRVSPAKVAKKTALWISGVTPARMMAQEMRSTSLVALWMVKNIIQMVSLNRKDAKIDKAKASDAPDTFWNEMVVSAGITDQTLRSRYRLASWGAYACLTMLSISIGVLAAYEGAAAVTVGNAVLINILLIMYAGNLHKLYTARNQRIISVSSFLAICIKTPSNLLPMPLPINYKLREVDKAQRGGDQ